jgi:hypothetical protein
MAFSLWRTKGKSDKKKVMVRRPETERILSREELLEFRRRLSLLSIDGVEGTYRTAYANCRLEKNRVPPAATIQQLVAAWKVLRKTRGGV